MSAGKGEAGFVSPYTGEVFTSRFAYNDHLSRWPAIAAANGLELDGSPKATSAEPPAPKAAPKPRARKSTK